MNKGSKIVMVVVAVLAVIAIVVIAMNSKPKSNLDPITSAEDLTALVDKIYEGVEIEMPMVMSQALDVTQADMVNYMTGLENGENLEYVVVSEPLMSSQAYSLILAKVKEGVDPSKVAQEMNENINERIWICVTAEKIYATNSGDVVCLVMSNEETAKAVYENFKTLAGTVGEEFERTAEEPELPEDMLATDDDEVLPGEDNLPAYDGEQFIEKTMPAYGDEELPATNPAE